MELIKPEFGLIIWTIFSLLALILMLLAIYSILTTDFKESNNKLTFLIGVIFLPILGPMVYLKNRKKFVISNRTK